MKSCYSIEASFSRAMEYGLMILPQTLLRKNMSFFFWLCHHAKQMGQTLANNEITDKSWGHVDPYNLIPIMR